jgi:hypothetical protein
MISVFLWLLLSAVIIIIPHTKPPKGNFCELWEKENGQLLLAHKSRSHLDSFGVFIWFLGWLDGWFGFGFSWFGD